MFTHRKAHSKGFWEHSLTSEGKKRERERQIVLIVFPHQEHTSVCACVSAV